MTIVEVSDDSEIDERPFKAAFEEMTDHFKIGYVHSILGLIVLFSIFIWHSLKII